MITRSRIKEGKEEKSILDFFVVCTRVLPYVTKMVIDEKKEYVLTNYKPAKKGEKAKDSDHFTQFMDLSLKLTPLKPIRKEIFNFQNEESLSTFKSITSDTNKFSKCFEDDQPLAQQIDNWRKSLKLHCNIAFKKIRIKNKKRPKPINPKYSALINERNKLVKNNKSEEGLAKIKEIEETIADVEAEESRNIVMENFKKFSDNPEYVNIQEVWKLMKNICPKYEAALPIAKRNFKGKLTTDPGEIKTLLAKEYKQRLRTRPVRPDLGDLKDRKRVIFNLHLQLAENTSTKSWNMTDLDRALGDLKNNKSRDHSGYVNEIFKEGNIGTDLKGSLLTMANKLKVIKMIPEFMRFTNLTTVPKKGSLTELENQRGIFRVDVVRSIIMKLVYNEKYLEIDENISDSQMGGRKGKGCNFNIFILNGIIHDILKNKSSNPVMFQLFDYRQMFDSMHLEHAISDIYEAGLKDANLNLVYEANKEVFMAVNTPDGLTERQSLENIVLQGDTFGSLLASVQVDSIGKECAKTGYGYRYKNILEVAMLGLVDDSVCITEAGYKAQMMNAFFNVRTAEKTLQFGAKKCKTMLIGKNTELIHQSKLSVDQWSVEHVEDRRTGDTQLVETYVGRVDMGQCDEQRYLGFVISNSDNNMANIISIKKKSIGTIRAIFNKLNKLNLRKYYFECGMIFLNVMLRSSILYASECYYNLKENELRNLERIEESFMRQLLKTKKGCPIVQLYLELGHIPARFGILKLRLFFLKTILDQEENSLIYRFFYLQHENPTKFDWASTCIQNLEEMNIYLSFSEIRNMTENEYKQIIRTKCEELAFKYLINKRGSKGKEINYSGLKMSEYLLPSDKLNIEEQRKLFSLRNNMNNIPANYCASNENTAKCICEKSENNEHLYICEYLNDKEPTEKYQTIFGENLIEMKYVLTKFEENLKKKEEFDHAITNSEPPPSVVYEFGNG